MSDFGALEINWRPPPQGAKQARRAKRGRRALARVVSREARKKQLGFGAEPGKILGFRCLNGLILCLLVTSKSCNIHNLHHRFLMKPTSVNCSKLSISQYKPRVMI